MRFIKDLSELRLHDVPLVGGKTASLGELIHSLTPYGINVPPGFAVTADAYSAVVSSEHLNVKIANLLSGVAPGDVSALAAAGREIRDLIIRAPFPKELEDEIIEAYRKLGDKLDLNDCDVAVRSSATAEDLPGASFAGQQETFLNIRGEHNLLEACRRCMASLYTDRAISYRITKGFQHADVRLSICVQKMIRSDLASSGVIFTLDPESGASNVVLVTSAYGLGENIVGGKVDPDEFLVQKDLLEKVRHPILRKKCGLKQYRLIYSGHGSRTTKNEEVSQVLKEAFSLKDEEVIELASWASKIEQHYSKLYGKTSPMDIEWGKDGQSGKLYILQARPETVHAIKAQDTLEAYELLETSKVLLSGRAVGSQIGSGPVCIIHSVSDLSKFNAGDVLVADMTDPDWEPVMKKASAIVTNRGGRTCHAAIIGREHGVPCLVGTGLATTLLQDGQKVTVSCASGEEGQVYDGILRYQKTSTELNFVHSTRTKLLVNLGNPDQALKVSRLPVAGVGLARVEFIITSAIGIHPLALLNFDEIKVPQLRDSITKILGPYRDRPVDFFVERLAEGVATIAGAFYPRPVIVRFSDFKTNEYAGLLGGAEYEPAEENPMIGFRGASRYYSPEYRDGFALECRAIKRVRDEMGLRNVKLMIPFCRTVEEGRAVLSEMKRHGLSNEDQDLEVYVMAEIPSNILCAKDFATIFDGFSIGSNDLTQMTLGVDRDSERLSSLFDERHPAVTRLISMLIQDAKTEVRPVSICGQAPSDHPEMVRWLVDEGITSISVAPDVAIKTLKLIIDAEAEPEKSTQLSTGG